MTTRDSAYRIPVSCMEDMRLTSQLKYVPDNAAILSGQKIARFYTISEMQAARNLYFQYVNYQ